MSEWISVKERLPENNQEILILLDDKDKLIARYSVDPGGIYDWDGIGDLYSHKDDWPTDDCKVTHWSPIVYPELPKEELKIEVGKVYETKDGERVLILMIHEGGYSHTYCLDNPCSEYTEQFGRLRCNHIQIPSRDLVKLSDNQFPGVI